MSRDISPGYRTWDVLEGSEFSFGFCSLDRITKTVLQRALHDSLELYVLLYPLWYVDIKDQLTEATVEELFGSQEAIIWFSGRKLLRVCIGFRLVSIY